MAAKGKGGKKAVVRAGNASASKKTAATKVEPAKGKLGVMVVGLAPLPPR